MRAGCAEDLRRNFFRSAGRGFPIWLPPGGKPRYSTALAHHRQDEPNRNTMCHCRLAGSDHNRRVAPAARAVRRPRHRQCGHRAAVARLSTPFFPGRTSAQPVSPRASQRRIVDTCGLVMATVCIPTAFVFSSSFGVAGVAANSALMYVLPPRAC